MSIPDQHQKPSSSSRGSQKQRRSSNDTGNSSSSNNNNRNDGGSSQSKRDLIRRIKVQMNSNPLCCDCSAPKPTWVSIIVVGNGDDGSDDPQQQQKVGAFCCYQCAIAHRALGTHICFVRSIGLDNITERDVIAMEQGGNQVVNKYFEATILESSNYHQQRPSADDDMIRREQYIREKYELKKYCRKVKGTVAATATIVAAPPPSVASPPKSGTPRSASTSKHKSLRKKSRSKEKQIFEDQQNAQAQPQTQAQPQQLQQSADEQPQSSQPQHQQTNMTNDDAESELQKHIDEMNKGPLIYTTNQDEVSELTEEVYSHQGMSSPRKNKSKNAISRLFSMAAKRFPTGKKGSSKEYHRNQLATTMEGTEPNSSHSSAMKSRSRAASDEIMLPLSASSNHTTSKKRRSKSKESQILPSRGSNRKLDKYYLHDEEDDDIVSTGGNFNKAKSRRRASMSNVPSRSRKSRSRSGSPSDKLVDDDDDADEDKKYQKPRSMKHVNRRSTMQHVNEPGYIDEVKRSKKDLQSSGFWGDASTVQKPSSQKNVHERRRSSMGTSATNVMANTTVTSATAYSSSAATATATATQSTSVSAVAASAAVPPIPPSRNVLTPEDKYRLDRARKKRSQKHDPLGRATFHGVSSSSNHSPNESPTESAYRRPASSKDIFGNASSSTKPSSSSQFSSGGAINKDNDIVASSNRRNNEPRRATMSMMSDYEREKMRHGEKQKNSRSCSPSTDTRWKDFATPYDTPTAPPKRRAATTLSQVNSDADADPNAHANANNSSRHRTVASSDSGTVVSPSSVGSEMYYHDGSITAVLPSPTGASTESGAAPSKHQHAQSHSQHGKATKPKRSMSAEQANAMSAFLDDLLGPSDGKHAAFVNDSVRQKAAAKLAELIQQTSAQESETATLPSLVGYHENETVTNSPDTLNPRKPRSLREFFPKQQELHHKKYRQQSRGKPLASPDSSHNDRKQDDLTIMSMDSDIQSIDHEQYMSKYNSSSKAAAGKTTSAKRYNDSIRSDTTEDKERAKQIMMLEGITESENLVSTPVAKKATTPTSDDNFDYLKTSIKSLPF
eukprot:CAMPEP_0119558974 /NCGR_PEP_ID=MMETSP1352-20130426/11729_1 /TAXON_ID=265584 /ORGANISM="Stauroneis constricta, Strain CCMP1120" /LENGTH=1068 /DNA_ID=CAMNT_0007606507 /DNA_START=400 /DNA_END=3606 /DNA_ORIENTATION=+